MNAIKNDQIDKDRSMQALSTIRCFALGGLVPPSALGSLFILIIL